jgi:hypothetical protein
MRLPIGTRPPLNNDHMKARVLLSKDYPMLADLRVFMRYLLKTGRRQASRVVYAHLLGREYRTNLGDVSTSPGEPHEHMVRSPGRWAIDIGLRMPRENLVNTVKDMRGNLHHIEVASMTFMPGFFDDFERAREGNYPGKMSQNSSEMAIFYVLKYGEVYLAEFRGSQEFFENDMTMIRVELGDKLSGLE